MEKGIITFKHNSPLMFFRIFAKLLATNCFKVYKFDAIIRLINTPLRMCRGRDMPACKIVIGTSLVIMT